MRRIAATLTVVVALLFSAGSTWADYDDDPGSANKLFVEAGKLISEQNIGAISLKGTTPWHMHHASLTNYPAIPGRFDRVVNSDAR